MQTIIKHDTRQIFNDWGQPAILEEVDAYFDPDTARMEESVVSSSLTVLAGNVQHNLSQQTAAVNSLRQILLIVQADEIPLNLNLITARVVFHELVFKVEAISQSHLAETVALECISTSAI